MVPHGDRFRCFTKGTLCRNENRAELGGPKSVWGLGRLTPALFALDASFGVSGQGKKRVHGG